MAKIGKMVETAGKRLRQLLLILILVPLAIGLAAGLAAKTTTWTTSSGGSVTGHASKAGLTDVTTHSAGIFCTSSTAHVTLAAGSELSGSGLGTLTKVTFAHGCWTLTGGHFPWKVNASSYTSGTGTTSGTITGLHLSFADGTFCHFTADGTGASADDGSVNFTYTNSTSQLKIATIGGNLHIYRVKGCGGAFHDGNSVTLSGTWTITPKRTITSP